MSADIGAKEYVSTSPKWAGKKITIVVTLNAIDFLRSWPI